MVAELLSTLLLVAQDAPVAPQMSLAPPPAAVKAGAVVSVGVYFRNGGKEPIALVTPTQIDAEIVTPLSRSAIVLTRAVDPPADRILAPGESAYVEYRLDLPDEIAGRVVLQLARLAAAPAVLDIVEPVPADGAAAATNPLANTEAPPDAQSAPPAPAQFSYAEAALQRFQPYEPMYFVAGTDRPNARMQFSFRYQIFNPEGPWASEVPFLAGIFLGYTQVSLWDLEGTSKPFTDTNYKPEFSWSKEQLEWLKLPGVAQTGMQFGVQHESNGRDGEDSRSINMFYVRPVLHFGDAQGFEAQVAPKIYAYLPDREDNPDIAEYRGNCDLRVSAGWADGFQAAAIGRLGSGGDKGSIQIDLTYPLRALGGGNFDLYLQVQWFSGYGESLITYDQYTDALRIGIGFVR